MQVPLQITFRDIEHSDAIEQHLRDETEKLNQFFSHDIISCHITIEQSQKRQHQGKLYNLHVTVNVPHREQPIVVNKKENENLYLAIRESYDVLRDQIKSFSDQMHGLSKNHAELTAGKVVRLFEDFGFIETLDPDHSEFYFHANNVVSPTFKDLKIGTHVHFIEAVGNEGPMARRVSAKKRAIANNATKVE